MKTPRGSLTWIGTLFMAATLSVLLPCTLVHIVQPPSPSSSTPLPSILCRPPPTPPGREWHGGNVHGTFGDLLRRKGIPGVPAFGPGLRGGGWEKTEGGGWEWVSEGGKVTKGKGALKVGTRRERRLQRQRSKQNLAKYSAEDKGKAEVIVSPCTDPSETTLLEPGSSKNSTDSTEGPPEDVDGNWQGPRPVPAPFPAAAVPGQNQQASSTKAKGSAWAPPLDLDIPLPPKPPPPNPVSPPLVSKGIVEQLIELSKSGGATDEIIELLKSDGVTDAELKAANLLPTLPRAFKMTAADGTPIPRGRLGLFPRWSSNGQSDTSAGLQPLLQAASPTLALTAGVTLGGQIVHHSGTDLIVREESGQLAVRSNEESFAVSVPVKGGPGLCGQRAIMTSGGLVYRDKGLEEWPEKDFRLFVGDLGQHVTDQDLTEAFRSWPGFNMARIVKDKVKRWRCRGYGFVSFATEEARRAVIVHQRRGKDSIDIQGRPVVVKASQWMKKVMTPEKMPEVRRIREKNEKLVGEGKLLPAAIGRTPTLKRKGHASGGRLSGPNRMMLVDGQSNTTAKVGSVSEEWKSDDDIVYDARADFGGISWQEAFAEDGPGLLEDEVMGPGSGMEQDVVMRGKGPDEEDEGMDSAMGMEVGVVKESQGETVAEGAGFVKTGRAEKEYVT